LPQPWTAYALALAAMLCLVVSGMLDDVRPRVVAGWLGLGLMIAAITWAVKGSLLRRSAFLAVAGAAAVALAVALSRLVPKEENR
jgi:Flp pilus assembly protein protease CpaA